MEALVRDYILQGPGLAVPLMHGFSNLSRAERQTLVILENKYHGSLSHSPLGVLHVSMGWMVTIRLESYASPPNLVSKSLIRCSEWSNHLESPLLFRLWCDSHYDT